MITPFSIFMLRSWRLAGKASPLHPYLRRGIADLRPFGEDDLVLLRRKDDRAAPPILTRPLKAGRRVESHRGVVRHDDIIGKRARDIVSVLPKRHRDGKDARGRQEQSQEYRLYEPTLDEYVRLTRRLVTPIYPADARLIVDLLDLHPHALLGSNEEEKLEILEAGTGHGALTLYLARAICGANGPHADGEDVESSVTPPRAVVHTIDISEKYSQHAEGVVQGFRNGLYSPHVKFHVGDVENWATTALAAENGKPFLSRVFLDLPGADQKLESVTRAMRVDGTVIVFNPSITQIMDVAKKIKDDGIPLELEKVIELGVNGGSGGREWDVRPVKPRVAQKLQEEEHGNVGDEEKDDEFGLERNGDQVAVEEGTATVGRGWSMVCRPKVGERVVGGGFLGLWKKQRPLHQP